MPVADEILLDGSATMRAHLTGSVSADSKEGRP